MTTTTYHPWRIASGLLGIGAAGLGCYGAWEYAFKLEGQWSYLVLASPLIAAAAAFIPPKAEWFWGHGERVKAALWWVALVPAVAVVFFSAAERTHVAKAGAQAGRDAARLAVDLAKDNRDRAQAQLDAAKAEADRTRKWKQCGPECRGIRDTEAARKADLDEAERKLLQARSQSHQDSPLQAPVWLLPAALDVIAFMAIWSGFSGPWRTRNLAQPVGVDRPVRKRKRTRKPPVKPAVKAAAKRAVNDNVVALKK
jgi:hypothetical protein